MLLKRKIPASSIAEVVIALTVIALCFGVASLVFIRSTNVTTRFMDVRKQTMIQSELLKHLYRQDMEEAEWDFEDVQVNTLPDDNSDSIGILEFRSTDDRIIWQQQYVKP